MAEYIPPTFSKEDIDDLIYHSFACGFGKSKIKDNANNVDDTQDSEGQNPGDGSGYVRPGKKRRGHE
jgi:hypothetical protein